MALDNLRRVWKKERSILYLLCVYEHDIEDLISNIFLCCIFKEEEQSPCEGETIFAYNKVSERMCCKVVSDTVGIQGKIITIWGNQENVYREFMVKIGLEREVIIAQKDNASGRL